jgi:hypothetical protein
MLFIQYLKRFVRWISTTTCKKDPRILFCYTDNNFRREFNRIYRRIGYAPPPPSPLLRFIIPEFICTAPVLLPDEPINLSIDIPKEIDILFSDSDDYDMLTDIITLP